MDGFLAKSRIQPLPAEVAIAQGSSERNISAVVSRDELPLALKAVLGLMEREKST